MDGSCQEVLTGRYHHTSAPLLCTSIDSLLDGFLVFDSRIFLLRSKLGDVIHFVRELGNTDALLNLLVLSDVPAIGLSGNNSGNAQQ